MELLTNPPSTKPSIEQSDSNKVRVGIYFFKPRDLFGWFIVALQWLVGGKWNSYCHMMHSVDKWLFETNTDGTMCSMQVDAAFRLADDVLYIMIDQKEAFELMEYSAFLVEDNIAFSWQDCVRYCWMLLTTPSRYRDISHNVGFGKGATHLDRFLVSPPFTCTAVVWDFLLEDKVPLEWNDFTPAKAYDKLKKYLGEATD